MFKAIPTSRAGSVTCTRSAAQRGCVRARARHCALTVIASDKMKLYSVPVSNFAARVRLIILWKGLQSDVDIVSPADLGGLKSAAYLQLNPQGKMPLLVLPGGEALPESEVISAFLLDKFQGRGPALQPATPEARAKAALVTRIHDIYLGPVQACMYRDMEPAARAAGVAEIARQLDVLEALACPSGPFVAGGAPCAADAALLPTFCFYAHILPRHFGWPSVFAGRPRLQRWWEAMGADGAAMAVRREVEGGLADWEAAGRFEKMNITKHVADKGFKWAYP